VRGHKDRIAVRFTESPSSGAKIAWGGYRASENSALGPWENIGAEPMVEALGTSSGSTSEPVAGPRSVRSSVPLP